ncbi:MAG: hypothetical protein JNJ83_12755 [Verrucomicrobiaceae bacterium]|nr:hypothetical protein [Verrucomicrobiaceae bacterium]
MSTFSGLRAADSWLEYEKDDRVSLAMCEREALVFGLQAELPVRLRSDFATSRMLSQFSERVQGVRLTEPALYSAVPTIARALGKYPVSLIKSQLEEICLFEWLSNQGVPMGGTYEKRTIFLAAGVMVNDKGLEKTFHHEFSSLFLNSYGDEAFRKNWEKVNEGQRYMGADARIDVLAARPEHLPNATSEALNAEGFIMNYSKSTLENDFNTLAGEVMTEPKRFATLMSKHKRLRQKYELWLSLMVKASSEFKVPIPINKQP